ncbi:unnamed protein product [Rhizoctonia solani]|uniref:3'-5' exonuclease domain-containing protein n=1 Tax=Rhizoctonia solani TaxID=456999 RepID=A0A8H3BYQ4_9AGAM|nr:unnamed protein product [Rhizoctonia solani]
MHRVSYHIVGRQRFWMRKHLSIKMQRQTSGDPASPGSCDSQAIVHRTSLDDHGSGPRKKSRKSTIMEALRRGTSQTDGTSLCSRQMSTSTVNIPTRSRSPISTKKAPVSSTGLPFYSHMEAFDSSPLPPLPSTNVKYLRDLDSANVFVTQMMDRMEPLPGSRWRGVVGFDMEWTVGFGMGQRKTGLIQLSDTMTILLIQISAMDSFPHRLKDLIYSSTILKVGLNVAADMKKLCRDFGPSYAARGVLDLSDLARSVDVGLIGTPIQDLDSNRATLGVGVPKTSSPTQNDIVTHGDMADPDKGDEPSDDEDAAVPGRNVSATSAKEVGANEVVRAGKKLISFARLVRRYLACELEKGDVRTSNWERVLSPEQKRYAANDAHAGLALYYALRELHSLSVAKGLIPIPSPAPWEGQMFPDGTNPSSPGSHPAPPPFRPKVTSRTTSSSRTFILTNELQSLTPAQLDSVLPWDSLIRDLHAELEDTRAAVLVKRKKEGVDLKGRGEAIIAAEAALAAEQTDAPSQTHISDLDTATASNGLISNPLGDKYYDNLQPRNALPPPSKGKLHGTSNRHAYQDKQNEVLGKKWPPTRNFAPRPAETWSQTSSSTIPIVSLPVSATKTPSDNDEVDSQPHGPTRPPMPNRSVSSSAPGSSVQSSSRQLRAYLLWHKQQLPLSQICASMRSVRYPLAKSTVISYIVEVLKADDKVPFDTDRLKALVALDTTNWVRENYREFLESKIGPLKDESQ